MPWGLLSTVAAGVGPELVTVPCWWCCVFVLLLRL